jgi:hypothetical protein
MINLEETSFDEVSDNSLINNICNEYYYQLMLKTKGIHLSKSRNFDKLKDKKPKEWAAFLKLEELCNEHNFDYKKYISYCLDEIVHIHKYVHIKYLLNIKYVRLFSETIEISNQYDKINALILASTNKIVEICKQNNYQTFSEFLKFLIREKKLGHYMKCGILSKYILALIPNINEIKRFFDTESVHELELYVINKYNKLNDDAIRALQKNNNIEHINIIKKINTLINT